MTNQREVTLSVLKDFGLDKLRQIILRSEDNDIEYGIRFCKNDKIKATDVCVGDNCNVTLESCHNEEKNVGSFHTHPTSEDKNKKVNILSFNDIRSSVYSKDMFACLGTVQKDKPVIKCFFSGYGIKKDIINKRENISKKVSVIVKTLAEIGYNKELTLELINLRIEDTKNDIKLYDEILKAAKRLVHEPDEGADLVVNL